jgi:hypothetical protein
MIFLSVSGQRCGGYINLDEDYWVIVKIIGGKDIGN